MSRENEPRMVFHAWIKTDQAARELRIAGAVRDDIAMRLAISHGEMSGPVYACLNTDLLAIIASIDAAGEME